MKRWFSGFLIVVFVALVGGTFWFLWAKSRKKPVQYETETPQVTDLTRKTVATGAIVPRQEVEIKPRVSGVLDTIHVEPGKVVKQGDPIAKIRVIPNAQALNRAEGEVRSKKIALDNARQELQRAEAGFAKSVTNEAELARARTDAALAQQAHTAAITDLQIVREGEARGAGARQSNVVVTSTVDGMVIDVPVKQGFSVIESNNFNPGTTIAVVADMNDMIFLGQVDESEVGKIKEGMTLKIKIGALEDQFEGKLEYIAPKGKEVEGAIQFEIKAAIARNPDAFIRAGYSANADIVLAERKGVVAVREALVQFDEKDGRPFVEVETAPQTFTRRDVKLGLSDGINVEVLEGAGKDDRIKVPTTAGPPGLRAGDGRSPLRGPAGRPRRAR
jgi:HlyD family secretion protein